MAELVEATSLRDEAVALLQALIRLDTVNPPGNETKAAELLRGYLEPLGIECRLYARTPERANLIARLKGRGDGPRLLLLSHTDTVLADPGEWQVDPWSGELRDGHVWGRGALDMKGQVAASAVAIASLAREGFRPRGDLLFAACADEEVGDPNENFGLSWLCEEHPEAVETEYSINEGAGDRLVINNRPVYLCATAEKRSAGLKLIVHGRSGHASMPGIADNALVNAAPYIERIGAWKPPRAHTPETEGFLRAVLGDVPPPDEALARARDVSLFAAETIEPVLSPTLSPTMIGASRQRNVIPGRCVVTIDCRLPPGQTGADVEPELRHVLGPGHYDLEWEDAYGGTRSPAASPLWDAFAEFIAEAEPGAVVAPYCGPGFTDSHYLRERFGTVAYGFFPLRAMDAELAATLPHSADERIDVGDLELGARCLRHAAEAIGA